MQVRSTLIAGIEENLSSFCIIFSAETDHSTVSDGHTARDTYIFFVGQ